MALLNGYLGAMSEVIQSYGGTIDEFLGDGILAFFGAPVAKEDDAERAVTCAVAMQRAMASVNERNRRRGLPEVEMGVGVSTGDVVVGNIGSEKRTKYGAVGSPVNLAGRIESYTLGGEIWISETTRRALGPVAEITAQRDVHPKGLEAPIRIHRLSGIGGATPLRLDGDASEFVTLDEAIPVRFALLEGKHVGSVEQSGEIWALSTNAAKLRSKEAVPELADLRIELGDDASGASYAKVVSGASAAGGSFTVRFTTTAGPLRQRLEALRGSAAPGS